MTEDEIKARISVERAIVQKLLDTAQAAGWVLRAVDDGGDELLHPSYADAMDDIFAVDECHVYFRKGADGVRYFSCSAMVDGMSFAIPASMMRSRLKFWTSLMHTPPRLSRNNA